MHAQILILILHITTIFASCPVPSPHVVNSNKIPDYYWKDYIGVIPEDAFEAGTDEVGNPTYVGQVYIKKYELLPAIITSGCKTAITSAYGKELKTEKNIKILCAKDKRKFEWVPSKKEDLHLLTGSHFVVGGSEVGQTLYIGRVNYENKLIIGKFFTNDPLSKYGIAIPYQGRHINFDSFEVLTYNVSKYLDEDRLLMDIDVRTQ